MQARQGVQLETWQSADEQDQQDDRQNQGQDRLGLAQAPAQRQGIRVDAIGLAPLLADAAVDPGSALRLVRGMTVSPLALAAVEAAAARTSLGRLRLISGRSFRIETSRVADPGPGIVILREPATVATGALDDFARGVTARTNNEARPATSSVVASAARSPSGVDGSPSIAV